MVRGLFLAALFLLTLASPFVGAMALEWNVLLEPGSMAQQVFLELRLPRLLLALAAGGALAVAGWLFQTLFRNALMTPYTLGISGGAVLGTGAATVLGLDAAAVGLAWSGLFGFAGALSSVALLLWLSARLPHRSGNALLLLGIALSFFYTAALMVLFYLSDAMQSHAILRYTMGSLATIGYTEALAVLAAALLLLAVLLAKRYELGLLGVHEDHARLKGVDTERLTKLLLLVASLAIGVLISIAGPIGFIGLIVPHIVRTLYRRDNTALIVPTFLFGGLFLAACDTLSRLPSLQGEIPIGVVTALIGGPFFVYLIFQRNREA
jgi:iron complex transport system permease protein